MILAVASGKGGTGKTTVAVNLAVALERAGRSVELVDCDVEAPNVRLFLDVEPVAEHPVTVPVPVVDPERCDGCGACGEACEFGGIVCMAGEVLVFPELCHSCGACALAADCGALVEEPRTVGQVVEGRAGGLRLVLGRLRIGEPRAVPVIQAARERSRRREVTVLDAPPGAACPVVATVRGADHVLLVTEPTPFGLHDLRQAVGLADKLGLPVSVLINRSDAGDDAVVDYCRARRLDVVGELPDDRRVAEAYARGRLLVDALPEYGERLLAVWERIREPRPSPADRAGDLAVSVDAGAGR